MDSKLLERFICVDCGVSTYDNDEYYMVHDHVWNSVDMYAYSGMLCIGCLENRLGRELTPSDFPKYPVNDKWFSKKSERLLNRLGV